MSTAPDPRVQDFERRLDDALGARPMMRSGGTGALCLAANIIDTVDAERAMPGHRLARGLLARGLQILAPTLISRTPGNELAVADVVADLEFAAHYHSLRDILYYRQCCIG